MLQKDPDFRPSVTDVLALPFIQVRIAGLITKSLPKGAILYQQQDRNWLENMENQWDEMYDMLHPSRKVNDVAAYRNDKASKALEKQQERKQYLKDNIPKVYVFLLVVCSWFAAKNQHRPLFNKQTANPYHNSNNQAHQWYRNNNIHHHKPVHL